MQARADTASRQTTGSQALQILRRGASAHKLPRNLGELSIHRLLIDLQLRGVRSPPVVLFEDAWFLRNAPSLARLCVLLGTQTFLVNAEKLGLIASAAAACEAIARCRPATPVIIAPPLAAKKR